MCNGDNIYLNWYRVSVYRKLGLKYKLEVEGRCELRSQCSYEQHRRLTNLERFCWLFYVFLFLLSVLEILANLLTGWVTISCSICLAGFRLPPLKLPTEWAGAPFKILTMDFAEFTKQGESFVVIGDKYGGDLHVEGAKKGGTSREVINALPV